jgi:outer membrane lipoprotein
MSRHLALLALVLPLGACATTPEFDLTGINRDLTPEQASAGNIQGQTVLWGGIIIDSKNLAQGTRLEILAYPLDSHHKPRTADQPIGRFLATRDSYLETVDYAPGRLVTLTGTLTGTQQGKIGDADYRYPNVAITALHLWSKHDAEGVDTRLHFGIGVVIH